MNEKESDNAENKEQNISEEGNISENLPLSEDQFNKNKELSDEDNEQIYIIIAKKSSKDRANRTFGIVKMFKLG